MKKRVLFICIHNSARSQMAEAFLNRMAPDRFHAESAGLEPGGLNPFVVKVMADVGIDISGNSTNAVADYLREGRKYDYVIAVCDKEAAERCPIFPGSGDKMHWAFRDPSSFQGSDEEKLSFAAAVRDEIRQKIEDWLKTV
ncbi:arsenate reductase ArsC [Geovibrio thiophilus]|uniref:Arsenate reductase ArsC n=1 Tax=Geovibrio thiophilus TaxID=139438 RepID=A0A410JZ41_9BACT|nr:arsenate reductase ArsC [Geovibrio thiophilus]QAR33399.1 arsenate reductase ArsC [Geovibrio thiophilus]